MRNTLLILFAGVFQLYASDSYSQNTRLTLDLNSVPVANVLEKIESNSEFYFLYNAKLIDVKREVSISVEDKKISDILASLFSGTGVNYKVFDRQIILTPSDVTALSDAMQQQQKITGTVTDSQTGEAMPGVNIVVKGTSMGAITDIAGNYSISVTDRNAILVFSFIGYDTQEIPLDGRATLDVILVGHLTDLEEVVVIGYGTMKRSDLTGSISSVSGADLAETLSHNLIEQAQGRIAGVDIVKDNGSPGSQSAIRIRGNRSIKASNDPLFIVDGIPTIQDIDDFNPSDIESIEVLKDASAVAIYGSRGANGVIIITTKKGKEGKTKFEFNNYYGIKLPAENIDVMNGQEFTEYNRIANGYDRNDSSNDILILGEVMRDNLQRGIETDWLDLILHNGMQQEHQLSVSGGSNDVKYYISGGYYFEEGAIRKTDFEKFSFRTNIDGSISEKFKVGVNLSASTNLRNQMPNEILSRAITYVPLVEPYDEDGNIIVEANPQESYITSPLLYYAPNQYFDKTRGYRFFSSFFGDYSLTKHLTYRLNCGFDYISSRRGQSSGNYYEGSVSTGSINNQDSFAYTIENVLTFDKKINEHALNIVGLFSAQKQTSENSHLGGRNIPISQSAFYDLGSAEEITGISSSLSEWGLLSYMGRINYRFKDKYLLTFSGRADGSSRLSKGNKWAFFPAGSIAWIISKENFFNIPTISFMKIRIGYGQVGNTSISPYQTLGGLIRSTYAFGNEGAFGFQHKEIENPELKWEISNTTNIGVDFELWDGRLSGSLEYYNTKTNDLLLQRFLPITSGFSSILENVGSTRNRGWEVGLSFNVIDNISGFRWDIDANVFSNKEEIVELFSGTADDVGNKWFIGYPINVFYDHKFNGIWQQNEADEAANFGQKPGDIKIKDVNGRDEEGNLTNQADGMINSDDRTVLGSTVPDWSGGLTNRIIFKGFNFSMLIYTRQGQMLNSELHNFSGNRWEGRMNAINFNYWAPDNPSNEIPVPKKGTAPLYNSALQFYDGSFVKIKNITLGYDFARDLIKIKNVSYMQLYLSATNPIILSKYNLVDPESSSGNIGFIPLASSTYMLGLNLKF